MPAVWGATAAEVATPTPADALVDAPTGRWVRAVSSHASPPDLWRWVCQLTVAPYSYDAVDHWSGTRARLPGTRLAVRLPVVRRSPRVLTPGADDLRVGQRLLVLFVVDSFAPGEHLTIRRHRPGRGPVGEFAVTYAVVPAVGGSRLVATVVIGDRPGRWAGLVRVALCWGDLVMMRRQLRTLAQLAAS